MDELKEMITRHEGKRVKPYKDSVGIITIGIGRNLEDRGLSEDEIDYLYRNDITAVKNDLKRNLNYYDALPDNAKIVLIDMCFNLGINRLLKFEKTLSLIKSGNYIAASAEMLQSKWAAQVGNRAIELSNILKKAK